MRRFAASCARRPLIWRNCSNVGPCLAACACRPRRTYNTRLTARLRQSVLLFRDLNEAALEKLAEIGEERSVPPGRAIPQGQSGRRALLYLRRQGFFARSGRDRPCHRARRPAGGGRRGRACAYRWRATFATATTLEACRLFVIERRAFLELLGEVAQSAGKSVGRPDHEDPEWTRRSVRGRRGTLNGTICIPT